MNEPSITEDLSNESKPKKQVKKQVKTAKVTNELISDIDSDEDLLNITCKDVKKTNNRKVENQLDEDENLDEYKHHDEDVADMSSEVKEEIKQEVKNEIVYSKEDRDYFLKAKDFLKYQIPVTIAFIAMLIVLIINCYSFVVAGKVQTSGFIGLTSFFGLLTIALAIARLVLGIIVGTSLLNLKNEFLKEKLHLYALASFILSFVGAISLLVINYLLYSSMKTIELN